MPVGASTITPYANVDYVQARLKAFTESGLQGAILTVEGGQSDHSFLTAGVKWRVSSAGDPSSTSGTVTAWVTPARQSRQLSSTTLSMTSR